jgi:hypothetical protein
MENAERRAPSAIASIALQPFSIELRIKAMEVLSTYSFNVDEYHRLGEVGIFGEDDRVELFNGDL